MVYTIQWTELNIKFQLDLTKQAEILKKASDHGRAQPICDFYLNYSRSLLRTKHPLCGFALRIPSPCPKVSYCFECPYFFQIISSKESSTRLSKFNMRRSYSNIQATSSEVLCDLTKSVSFQNVARVDRPGPYWSLHSSKNCSEIPKFINVVNMVFWSSKINILTTKNTIIIRFAWEQENHMTHHVGDWYTAVQTPLSVLLHKASGKWRAVRRWHRVSFS